MGVLPLPQRVVRAVSQSPVSERVADAQSMLYAPILAWARHGPLRTDALGHSEHPALTDVTLGCWVGTSILDLVGGPGERRASTILVGAGLIAALPTAVTGAGDWSRMSGEDRRIGAVHALGSDIALLLFGVSLVLRLRGRHTAGARLALAGNTVAAGAGFLGGHLALNRGTARRPRR